MRNMCIVIALLCAGLAAGQETNHTYRLMFRDYSISDQQLRPMSAGICTSTDSEHTCRVGGYFDVALISMYEDRLRMGAGVTFVNGDEHPVDIRLITSVSTRVYEGLHLGAYYAPFWGLARSYHDDPPYGIMIGYSFPL